MASMRDSVVSSRRWVLVVGEGGGGGGGVDEGRMRSPESEGMLGGMEEEEGVRETWESR